MKIGTIYDIIFTTNRADTGALADADSTPVVRILEDSSLMPYIPPVTNIGTGKYVVTIDTGPDENGFSPGQRYAVYATATVNGIEGAIGLDHFVGETQGVDDILPTTTYAAPYTPTEIREELAIELGLITTNLDATVSSRATVDGVWDEPLTGATHNVPTSAGRRLRQLAYLAIHDGTAQGSGTGDNQIQLDTGASATNGAYDPAEIAIIAGTGAGQSRLILQYNGATKTATVDRNWRVKPDATSEFIIYVNSGREHVNEGLAQGGTANTITLNANASSTDNAYVGQTIFLRSGTGEDQVASVTAYNGTTKVATIYTSMTGNEWAVIPDTTTGYVMLPQHSISSGGGGGGLTTEEHAHLMKLRNGGGGAMINYESIEKGLAKDRKWLYEKIGEIPGLIAGSEGRVIDAVGLVNTTISTIMDSKDTEALAESMGNLAKETAKATELANQVAIESKRKSEKLSHTLETKILEDEIKEEAKDLKEAHEKKVDQEVKALEVDAQIQDEVQKLAQDAQIQDEIKSLESNF